jgi:hypothetical protein
MKPSEVLREYGRCQGDLYREGRFCLVGAWALADGQCDDSIDSLYTDSVVYREFRKSSFSKAVRDVIVSNNLLPVEYLTELSDKPDQLAYTFNDSTTDTQLVLDVLEKAEAEVGWIE